MDRALDCGSKGLGVQVPSGVPWRGAAVVERGGLENRYTGNRIEGSNPSLSAIISEK